MNTQDPGEMPTLPKEEEELTATPAGVEGELPTKGLAVVINGMIFQVKFVDYKRAELRLRLMKNYKLAGNQIVRVK